jgi:hypothetical protein
MKKEKSKKSSNAPADKTPILAFSKTNYIIFAIAVVVLIIGYYFLSIGPADSVQSLTIAPIILVIGYVILVPLAIFWRKKAAPASEE